MATEAGPLSGFRDMLADQMIPRTQMITTIRTVYEGYGFTPLETPALERAETLKGKYGDAEKLIYRFVDHGGREVALRYDLTVPLARVVGQHRAELSMPYKRYQVGPVWRADSPQAGRYREFAQFDADTVGTKSVLADAEVVVMMSDAMSRLGASAQVRVNNRRILDGLVEKAGITDPKQGMNLIGIVDKVDKIGIANAAVEVEGRFDSRVAELTRSYLNVNGSSSERLDQVGELLKGPVATEEGIENMQSVFSQVQRAGYGEDQVTFDPTIARGLDYYTGVIYETTLTDLPGIGSVCSGGRFDNLVARLGGPELPAVGTSIGVDRLFAGLEKLGKVAAAKTNTQVMIANFGLDQAGDYLALATVLRHAGVATEVYYDADRLGKQLRHASKQGIRYVLMSGEDEKAGGLVSVKDMQSGKQDQIPVSEVLAVINNGYGGAV